MPNAGGELREAGGRAEDAGAASATGGAGQVDVAQACTDAGGSIETIGCCHTVGDLPNVGNGVSCDCSSGTHDVLSCRCPDGEYFDGTTCGFDCGPAPDCNFCGGQPLSDGDGCTVGFACSNGRDACEAEPCDDSPDCTTEGEECAD